MMTKTIFLGHEISHPSYIPMTAWLRHGPFAMWLVRAARPGKIVELGSHYGYSYFAFCQAVKEAGLPTRCIAVDTWQGDEHAGRYGEEVFDTVQKQNRPYAGFSTLLRKTFAEALADVEDGSVDILHLDGRHFYDDIKEDHESWLPKLADSAVVLFHDTEVRERGFGVWQYWAELTKTDPSFNFWYQHGLGVLFRGDDLTPEMAAFRRMTQEEAGRDALAALFWTEGHALAGDHTQAVLAGKAAEGPAALSGMLDVLKSGQLVPENQIRPLDTGGVALATAALVATERARAATAQAQAATERAQAAAEHSDDLSARLETLSNAVSHHQAQLQSVTSENQLLRGELAYARSHVMKIWKDRLVYRVLNSLASGFLPISERARLRFAKSARKRDPRRTLMVAGQTAEAAQLLPATSGEFQVIPGRRTPDPERRNVLLVSHEASRTGAPILVQNVARVLADRYNVTILSTRGGDILDAFLDVSVDVVITGRNPQSGNSTWRFTERFLSTKPFAFAVVNSIESRRVLPILHGMGITSVSLIHEFASFFPDPEAAYGDVMKYADHVVFSSSLTLNDAAEMASLEFAPKVHVFPQGKCVAPKQAEARHTDIVEQMRLKTQLRPDGSEDDFVIMGAGHVQPRKGVDLFIEVARQAIASAKGRKLRFVWIGDGFNSEIFPDYFLALKDQLKRSGMVDAVQFVSQTHEIEYAYGLADLLLLPSRLDPLPNVAIDAMMAGLPVLCFDGATGIADVLRQAALDELCVADYINTADMAGKLLALANSPELYAGTSAQIRAHAGSAFDLEAYAHQIEDLALAVNERKSGQAADIAVISSEPNFVPGYVLPFGSRPLSATQAAEQYLTEISVGTVARRPEPGFNPHIYARHLQASQGKPISVDPYAEFLRQGRPEGPWSLAVIRETGDATLTNAAKALRCALHIHAYYVDELEKLLTHLSANTARPALYISVVDQSSEAEARHILSGYDGDVTIRIVPNIGRDIGPFLTAFGAEMVNNHDVVGHVHTKKSLALSNDDLVKVWTRFLFENVLGGDAGGAMLDRTLNAFASDDTLGMVYPADPNLIYWSRNRNHPLRMAARMELGTLPDNFDFPVGTMFWMRAETLRPFVDLNLGWADYPSEPISIDGTMLHALERLFGIAPVLQGYRVAVTSVTGVTR